MYLYVFITTIMRAMYVFRYIHMLMQMYDLIFIRILILRRNNEAN